MTSFSPLSPVYGAIPLTVSKYNIIYAFLSPVCHLCRPLSMMSSIPLPGMTSLSPFSDLSQLGELQQLSAQLGLVPGAVPVELRHQLRRLLQPPGLLPVTRRQLAVALDQLTAGGTDK